MARRRVNRRGKARQAGIARHGMAGSEGQRPARPGKARRGLAGGATPGKAVRGGAWYGRLDSAARRWVRIG